MEDSSPPGDSPPGHTGWQYRITYDRPGWTRPRLQYVALMEDAEAFIARLQAGGELTKLELRRRPVGTWEKCPLDPTDR